MALRREENLGGAQVVPAAEAQLGAAAELGMDLGDRLAAQPLRGDLGDLDVGVAAEQPEQLAPGVAGPAEDGGPHRLSSLSASLRTAVESSSSVSSTASSGVWSRWESPGP